MGVAAALGLSLVLAGRFVVEVAAVVVGLLVWERWFKRG
jgi:hypothetical protein